MNNQRGRKVLRMKGVMDMTGLSRSAIYKKVADNQFPRQIKLGARASGWLFDEVAGWLNNQVAISRPGQGL